MHVLEVQLGIKSFLQRQVCCLAQKIIELPIQKVEWCLDLQCTRRFPLFESLQKYTWTWLNGLEKVEVHVYSVKIWLSGWQCRLLCILGQFCRKTITHRRWHSKFTLLNSEKSDFEYENPCRIHLCILCPKMEGSRFQEKIHEMRWFCG